MNPMKKLRLATAAATTLLTVTAQADQRPPQATFGPLEHVFIIMMENEDTGAILGNATYAPFINSYAAQVNQATNYYAVGHPSAPNYLEIVGGSNFGLTNDYWPAWIGTGCVDNAPGSSGCAHALTPISGTGTDNPVVATAVSADDCNGQLGTPAGPVPNNCALYNYPAANYTGESIADQLVARSMSWKAYEESLPTVAPAVFGVNYSDGVFSNLSSAIGGLSVFAPGPIQKLYAVKHNPFAYFANIEQGSNPALSLSRVVDFDGANGLWADLQRPWQAPNLFFIVPNQCHDMHGFVSGGTPVCSSTTTEDTSLLITEGDAQLAKIVNGIKASPTWPVGHNAIVVVWDEDDYDNVANKVVMLVETNYAHNRTVSAQPYDHYSLLRTLEAGFGLPCLNHACDATSHVMNDLFGGR
jgi:phosphatidylinositol-3-phosphatase